MLKFGSHASDIEFAKLLYVNIKTWLRISAVNVF